MLALTGFLGVFAATFFPLTGDLPSFPPTELPGVTGLLGRALTFLSKSPV